MKGPRPNIAYFQKIKSTIGVFVCVLKNTLYSYVKYNIVINE